MRYKIADCVTEYEPHYEMLRQKDGAIPDLREKERHRYQICTLTKSILRGETEGAATSHEKHSVSIFLQALSFIENLFRKGGMMLHASAVEVDGKAYLFSADSGTGKSTHTKQWQNYFGKERALIINDDKPAIRKDKNRMGCIWDTV
ncbi:MAG: hypothetical protein ACLTLQ_10945 [[Clostridium] scindens]